MDDKAREAASKAAQQAWLATLNSMTEADREAYLAEAAKRGINPNGTRAG